MSELVIDTNVLLVANGSHPDVSATCRLACIARLEAAQKAGTVVIDDGYRLLSEYRNKTQPNQPKGVGDAFLKWLLQNQANAARVHQVCITPNGADSFEEFPTHALQAKFDPPDRKFVAVANAHPNKPPILQAADCKWIDWWEDLAAHQIIVEFLCPSDAKTFYQKKFPGKDLKFPT